MTATTGILAAVRYVRAVEAELADLPEDERAELLEDVEQHVVEVAAEVAAAGGVLEERLGPPGVFAAEFRAAAGLPARTADEDGNPVVRAARRLAESAPGRGVADAWAVVSRHPAYAAVRGFLPELRPGWWVLRGYLAVAVPSWLVSDYGGSDFPIPAPFGSQVLGLLALAVAIPLSVRLGRRGRPRHRGLALAANGLLAAAAIGLAFDAPHRFQSVEWVHYEGRSDVATGPYGQISNIYAYAPDGTPIENVRLYDQHGNPLSYVATDFPYHAPRTADGELVHHAFPRRPVPGADVDATRPGHISPITPPGLSPTPSPSVSESPAESPSPKPKPKPARSPKPRPTPSPTR